MGNLETGNCTIGNEELKTCDKIREGPWRRRMLVAFPLLTMTPTSMLLFRYEMASVSKAKCWSILQHGSTLDPS